MKGRVCCEKFGVNISDEIKTWRERLKLFDKRYFLFWAISSYFLLSSCLPLKPVEEKIYHHLEGVVQFEEDFEKQQEPLLELEQEEKKLYNEILEVGFKNREQLTELAQKGIELADERKELLDKERKSMVNAQEEFAKVDALIEKIKGEDLKDLGGELYSIMNERYRVHKLLYEEYLTGIQYDKKLYQLLQHEDVSLEELEVQINEINEVYRRVYSLNERFNELTDQYNEIKIRFYEQAGLQVKNKNSRLGQN